MGLKHPYELFLSNKSGYRYKDDMTVTLSWNKDTPKIACNGRIAYPNETFEYLEADWLLARKQEGLTNGRIAELCNTTEDKVKHACRKLGITGFVGKVLKGGKTRTPWNKNKSYKQLAEVVEKWHREDIWSKAVETKRRKGLVNSYYSYESGKRTQLVAFANKVKPSVLGKWGYKCALTGETSRLELHHIDPIFNNKERAFDEANLLPLTQKVHRWIHSANLELELLQWVEEGKDLSLFLDTYKDYKIPYKDAGKIYLAPDRVLKAIYSSIKSIEFVGVDDTYDIEVAGKYKNFIADGIVVHNSRAVPVTTMIQRVKDNPFVPIFTKNQRGMIGADTLNIDEQVAAHAIWLEAMDAAIEYAERLQLLNIHKEATNRLMEPYMSVDLVLSGTEFEHFFMLRDSPNAQKSFAAIAKEMHELYEANTPQELSYGEWHIPFDDYFPDEAGLYDKLRIAIARCARLSYLSHDKDHSTEKDFELFDRLWTDKHWSPFEHVAQVVDNEKDKVIDAGGYDQWGNYEDYNISIREYLPESLQEFLFLDETGWEFKWTRQYAGFYTFRSQLEDGVNIV